VYASDPQFYAERLTWLGTLTLRITAVSPSANTQILYNGNPLNVKAGQYQITITSASLLPGVILTNTAFCVDLDHWMTLNRVFGRHHDEGLLEHAACRDDQSGSPLFLPTRDGQGQPARSGPGDDGA
jgi:hypothetical protein